MPKKDPRIDAYIAKSAPFAQPILRHLRSVVHQACPDVEETVKWGMPSFTYHGILCGMAAFKQHATFGFWKASLILDKDGNKAEEAHGQFGRLTAVKDLPSKAVLMGYVKQAMKLNDEGTAMAKPRKGPKPPARIPADLAAALKRNAKANAVFREFSASGQREYIEWIEEARTDATRQRRLVTTIEWVAEGKQRNWKYQNC
ncbi:MAG: YdeI/OmpD-associated family protein [Gemmatimonadota bacterium]